MSFLIRITGPRESHNAAPNPPGSAALEEMKMEELIHQIFIEENILDDTWQISRNGKYFVVEFPVIGQTFAEKILDRLSYYNVGKTEDSNIMVIDPAVLVCKRSKAKETQEIPVKHFQKFVNSLKSRLTVAQVYHAISNQGNFNFNYLCFLICAAIVADIALVTDSAACVFASMLLSPLMEPIMCIIFGLSLREKRMTMKGFRNTTVSLLICIIVGILFGIPAHFISMFQGVSPYPTSQMSSRGEAKALIGSVIVAATSGVSVSFAILSNSLAAMIGNAISLSLLPPSVNCGQFFLLAVIALIDRPYVMKRTESLPDNSTISVTLVQCKYRWIKDYEFIYVTNACDAPNEFAILGVVSFCLALLNIILIIITGYSVNRLKDLVPQSFTNGETRRFYTKDLKEVRDNYDCVHRLKAADLATQAYQEYLRLSLVPSDAGLSAEDTDQLTADFQAVMEGIGQDRHLQTISSLANGGNTDFIAEFTRATEALAHNGGVRVGNERASNNFSLPRVSIASDGAFGRNEVQLRPRRQTSCIERSRSFRVYHDYRHVLSNQATLKCGSALGAARLMHLRQLAATVEGDLENNGQEKEEKQEDSEKTISPDDPEAAAPSRFTYQQHQHSSRQSHAGFWQNLLCKRSASLAMHSENHSQWPSQGTPEAMMSRPRREGEGSDERNAGNDQSFFQTELSRVPSEESNASSSEEASISVTGTSGAQIEKHHPISRSDYDVSSLLPRNRSLASVSTIVGKFEVTPTIKKPHSTKNLNTSAEKGT